MISDRELSTTLGKVKYVDNGTEEKAIIFIHGGFGDAGPAVRLDRFFGKEFRVIAPYLPGHAPNDSKILITYPQTIDLLAEFVKALKVRDYVLIGHSLGGRVVLDLGRRKDLEPRMIISISPLLARIDPRLIVTAASLFRDHLLDNGINFRVLVRRSPLLSRFGYLKPIWSFVSSVPDIEPMILRTSCVIIWSSEDSAMPMERNRKCLSRLKNIKLLTFPGGHYWFFKNDKSLEIIKKIIS